MPILLSFRDLAQDRQMQRAKQKALTL